MPLKGITYLRKKLELKKPRIDTRYNYYEMKNIVQDYSPMVPPEMRWIMSCLGWCSTAVDALADRLIFREFGGDNFDLNSIYTMNNPDVLFDNAILSALISSCSFIYIHTDEDGMPKMQVIDGGNATGILDDTTGLLFEGYAVLERDDHGQPTIEAYFIPGETHIYRTGEKQPEIIKNLAPYPLLVPIINRPDAKRPFGHSRISRSCMNLQQGAMRTIRRSEISAEFYSFPQKYVLGFDNDAEPMDKWRATMSSLLVFGKDEDGDRPSVGQFTQQNMQPYIEQVRMFAALFAGETGLTLDDLGFVSDNPSSSEAIKAAHERLRITANKAKRTFGTGFLNAGYLAACLRDEFPYKRRQIYLTTPLWAPTFEPDAATLSSIGDGVIKINQAVPGYFNSDNLRGLTGIKQSDMPTE